MHVIHFSKQNWAKLQNHNSLERKKMRDKHGEAGKINKD